MRLRIEADRPHEAERLGNAVGEFPVSARLRAVLDEAEHPAMRVFEIGIAPSGEGTNEIECRRRLAIGIELALRIGSAGRGGELDVVDDIAAIAREFDAADLLHR